MLYIIVIYILYILVISYTEYEEVKNFKPYAFVGRSMLNSHGRHVSVYCAVYPTLVLKFRVIEVCC